MSSEIEIYQVDAFTRELFAGNPAAVCPLTSWLPDPVMQAIARENNLSETAFFVRLPGGVFELRWFTPEAEVDLCGHATLATAEVIFGDIAPELERIELVSPRSGALSVERDGDRFVLDFPAISSEPIDASDAIASALGSAPVALRRADRYLAIYERAEQVQQLEPDFRALRAIGDTVCVTAPGEGEIDFVSRYFAPAYGIDEDPVTGSAHCVLVPYWSARLCKKVLRARQISARGGELWLEDRGSRVRIAGHATRYLRGTIRIP